MSKVSLEPEQLRAAKDLDKALRNLTKVRDTLKDYKLGEIYVLQQWYPEEPEKTIYHETSMGFPAKFQVVHISDEGIPYLRKLTSAGNPAGEAYIPPEAVAVKAIQRFGGANIPVHEKFVPDPEQMDSILLQTEFDPMAQHREISKLYNEINKHNKNVSVSSSWQSSWKDVSDYFKSRQPGDKFWTSPDKQYVIQSVAKVGREYVITCSDWNKMTVTFGFGNFHGKRLYKEQPRSFKKESEK
jgi:hypothetical protein